MSTNKLTESEVIQKIEKVLDSYMAVKEPETYVLKWKGNIIRMPSSKSSWKKKHHALSAFTNANFAFVSGHRDSWSSSDVTKLLIEKGILEVIKIN